MAKLPLDIDRAGKTPLAEQIYGAIQEAIEAGRIASGGGCRRGAIWRLSSACHGVLCVWRTNA